ncbi:MAG: SDR family oxidoreductase [Methylocapsa sp.]|nr:SDR family oxidoreductase [Methylocapsa sp.]
MSSEADTTSLAREERPEAEARPAEVRSRRVTLITGASGGIGADLARVFARHGHDLALVARSGDKLEALADELTAAGTPRPLVIAADLTKAGAVAEVAAVLKAAGASPGILVNNAGFGLLGEAFKLDAKEQLAIADLNIRAVMEMTLTFLPAICAAQGKILNVASVAGYFPGGPGMAAYYASKAFLLSYSRALHQELRGLGVTVSAVCPGYTATGFQMRAGINTRAALAQFPSTTALEVAEAGYKGLMAGRREIVPGFFNRLTVLLLPFLPKPLLLSIVSRLQKNRPL